MKVFASEFPHFIATPCKDDTLLTLCIWVVQGNGYICAFSAVWLVLELGIDFIPRYNAISYR